MPVNIFQFLNALFYSCFSPCRSLTDDLGVVCTHLLKLARCGPRGLGFFSPINSVTPKKKRGKQRTSANTAGLIPIYISFGDFGFCTTSKMSEHECDVHSMVKTPGEARNILPSKVKKCKNMKPYESPISLTDSSLLAMSGANHHSRAL